MLTAQDRTRERIAEIPSLVSYRIDFKGDCGDSYWSVSMRSASGSWAIPGNLDRLETGIQISGRDVMFGLGDGVAPNRNRKVVVVFPTDTLETLSALIV